jgi:hypothetical protein
MIPHPEREGNQVMKNSISKQSGMVRSVTLALAAVVTSFIFTSVAVVFTAGAGGTSVAAGQVAHQVQVASQSGA